MDRVIFIAGVAGDQNFFSGRSVKLQFQTRISNRPAWIDGRFGSLRFPFLTEKQWSSRDACGTRPLTSTLSFLSGGRSLALLRECGASHY
jgi:hypothetical protein